MSSGNAPAAHRPRALGLISGGQDSALAARLAVEAGIDVVPLHLWTGCELPARRERVQAEARAGRLRILDVRREYVAAVAQHLGEDGPGSLCAVTRPWLLARAAVEAERCGIRWLVTGEVVGQRRHGTRRDDLVRADECAGIAGRVLRPLSAALLPQTEVARDGAFPRERGLALHGRSRRGQLALAAQWGIEDLPVPSGACCRLEQAPFVGRLRDWLEHSEAAARQPDELALLALGRHYRVSWRAKVAIGRDEAESVALVVSAGRRTTCVVADGRGASGVLGGEPGPADRESIAAIAVWHSAHRRAVGPVEVRFAERDGTHRVETSAATATQRAQWDLG